MATLEDYANGSLPLVSAGCSAVAAAFPGAPLEPWEREVMKGVLGSVALSTLRSYKKAWADFLKFRNSIPNSRQDSPPSKREVLRYLVHLKELGRAAKTLNIQSSAISFFCKALFSTDPCADFVVRKALKGWRRLQPPGDDKRRPITYDILTQIQKKLRAVCWSKYKARLFSAAYSLAFFGALRIGEVVCEGGPGSRQRGILLSDLTLSSTDLIVQVRSSKTDQWGRGAFLRLLATQKRGPCPVRDTRRFLYLRPNNPSPFIIHADGSLLARHQFTCVMRLAIAACGLPAAEFAAHSFQIGAATTAVHLGLSAERIKDMGRWKSDAYKAYCRPGFFTPVSYYAESMHTPRGA
ncbi:integrase/recombinase xerD homolog [Podarcis muralis]